MASAWMGFESLLLNLEMLRRSGPHLSCRELQTIHLYEVPYLLSFAV